MKTIAKLALLPMLLALTTHVVLAAPPSIPMPSGDSTPPSLDPADGDSTPPSLDPAVDSTDPDPVVSTPSGDTPSGGYTPSGGGGGGILLNNDSDNDGIVDADDSSPLPEGVPYNDYATDTDGQSTPKTGPEVMYILLPGLLASYGANRYLATKKAK